MKLITRRVRETILPLALLLFVVEMQSQILPPDFLCVRGDTLIWETPTNTCGPFESYEIYFATAEAGPFSLLATVNDAGQTNFYHQNPSGQDRYYYLATDADCPGQTQIFSDTLDNRSPEISPIRSVSVDGTDVVIRWRESPSPETVGYIVYRETQLGTIDIATVGLTNTYTDPNAMPLQRSETYFVNAVDACGNTSLFDLPHSTLLLDSELIDCDPNVYLDWQPYENWPDGVETYNIYVSSDDGTTFELAGSTIETTFAYPEGNDGETLCFYVEAAERNGDARANSNEVCQTLDIVQPNRDFAVLGVDVNADSLCELRVNFQNEAQQNEYRLFRVDLDGDTLLVESGAIPTGGNPVPFVDASSDPAGGAQGYFLETTDVCGNVYRSTYGASIHLVGETDGATQNIVGWNGFFLDNSLLQGYELFAAEPGANFGAPIASFGTNDQIYSEALDVSDPDNAIRCYRIEAFGRVQTPDGNEFPFRVGSNVVCVRQPTKLFVPNAFTPGGLNPEFLPIAANAEGLPYSLRIFDRYGRQLFETDNLNEGWNGRFDNGRAAPVGTYVYQIQLTQENGTVLNRRGSLVLIR